MTGAGAAAVEDSLLLEGTKEVNSDFFTLGLCTETLWRCDILSAGWGVYGVPG